MIVLFQATAARRKAAGRAFVPTWIFVLGYLLVWTVIGGITWILVQVASDAAGQLGFATRETWGPPTLGIVLVMAGPLPADAAQARLPRPLSQPVRVRDAALARGGTAVPYRWDSSMGSTCQAAAGHSLRCWWQRG